MFERYTEIARRCIFFARYEAGVLGTSTITLECLLLGILREDKRVAMRLPLGAVEAIRKKVEEMAGPRGERVPMSVDLPISMEMTRALAQAAEECEKLNHMLIDAPHLVLGLLREESSLAAELLRKYGINYEQYREIVSERNTASAIQELSQLVNTAAARLYGYSDEYGDERLYSKPWTKKEALGHLIDCAILHQQWVTGAVMESALQAAGYADDEAVAVQHYAEFPWADTLDLWVSLNRLLIHVLSHVPEEKLDVQCRIGSAKPVSLKRLIEAYVEYSRDIVGRILARLD